MNKRAKELANRSSKLGSRHRQGAIFTFVLAVFWLLALIPSSAFAQAPKTPPTPSAPIQDENYRIQAEDVITVLVQDVPEVGGDFLVRKDGKITVPVAGEVDVAGKTTRQIATRLTELFKKEIKNPLVTVNLKQSSAQRIYVMGAVHTPGVLDWKPKWRLTEVIAAAGGLMNVPERTKVLIFRTGSTHILIPLKQLLIDGDDSANREVEPGDVINFQTDVTLRVQVVGQVAKPGEVEVLEGQGVVEVLAAAGGSLPNASLATAKLNRDGKDIFIDLYTAAIKGDPTKDIPVADGDTLYVPSLLTRISVIGYVGKPGPIPVPDGEEITLTQALALAGGPIPRAKLDSVGVIRTGADRKLVATKYDVKDLLRGDKGLIDPVLNNGDIVYIAGSGKFSTSDIIGTVAILDFFRNFTSPF